MLPACQSKLECAPQCWNEKNRQSIHHNIEGRIQLYRTLRGAFNFMTPTESGNLEIRHTEAQEHIRSQIRGQEIRKPRELGIRNRRKPGNQKSGKWKPANTETAQPRNLQIRNQDIQKPRETENQKAEIRKSGKPGTHVRKSGNQGNQEIRNQESQEIRKS